MSQFQASKAMVLRLLTVLVCAGLAACGDIARLPPEAGEGANPALPPPVKSLADRITLLRDTDGDGVAETKCVFIDKAALRRRNPLKTR